MKKYICLLFVYFTTQFIDVFSANPEYLDEICGKSLPVQPEVLLRLSRSRQPSIKGTKCGIHFQPKVKHGNVSGTIINFKHVNILCDQGHINVVDGKSNQTDTVCGHHINRKYATTPQKNSTTNLELSYNRTVVHSSFEAIITAYHESPCFSNELQCDNGRCVDISLLCNGHDNCGDDSDELHDKCGLLYLTAWAIVGIVVGSLLLIIFVPCCIICFCCKRRQRVYYTRI